jgi:hypothetical protein
MAEFKILFGNLLPQKTEKGLSKASRSRCRDSKRDPPEEKDRSFTARATLLGGYIKKYKYIPITVQCIIHGSVLRAKLKPVLCS